MASRTRSTTVSDQVDAALPCCRALDDGVPHPNLLDSRDHRLDLAESDPSVPRRRAPLRFADCSGSPIPAVSDGSSVDTNEVRHNGVRQEGAGHTICPPSLVGSTENSSPQVGHRAVVAPLRCTAVITSGPYVHTMRSMT